MSTVEVLRKARELYAQAPSHGRGPVPKGTHCVISAVIGAARHGSAYIALASMYTAAGTDYLSIWNAENDTATVLASFDAAIEAEAQ